MSESLLVINSEDQDPNNFVFNVNSHLLQDVKQVSLVGVYLLNDQYNVNEGNNSITFPAETLAIPVGQYTYTELETYINSNNVSGAVLSKDALTGLVSVAGVATVSPAGIGWYLGFPEALAEGSRIPNLSGLNLLHVSSTDLAAGNSLSADGQGSIIGAVPVSVAYGEFLTYASSELDLVVHRSQLHMQSIHVRLLDDRMQPAYLQNPITIVLKIS